MLGSEGYEPRVLVEDVRRIISLVIRPDDPDVGDSVQLLAERAETSERTVYRVLDPRNDRTLDLGLADRLVIAAGGHLMDCRLMLATGSVVPYMDA